MATQDISRNLFRPDNHYTGVRVQQRRQILDSDINEGEMLDDEDLRATAAAVLGPHGSPDGGFAVDFVQTPIEFKIAAGSYYIGGLRFVIEGSQTLRTQLNWLQSNRILSPPNYPPVPFAARWDLIYLFGWEQAVSAVEDREIQEQALGGPDTVAQLRRMHRVRVRVGNPGPEECHLAFAALLADLKAGGHGFDEANHELKSAARLAVVEPPAPDGDLCKPALLHGYSGSENQTIRVELIAPDRFLWSRDNAAPLYRVSLPTVADTATITFLTPPRDHAHFPAVGQVLELLPWGATLANGEHTADLPIAPGVGGGLCMRIVRAYDPTLQTIQVSVAQKSELTAMNKWFEETFVPAADRHYYARVWNPGDDQQSNPIGVPIVPNTDIPLVGTGLSIRFNQTGIVGDHWILAARPATPELVVPWEVIGGGAPHGPRRFYCPLAMTHWFLVNDKIKNEVHSCRGKFRPLTRQGGCCTVTVGDDEDSLGDFPTIAAALAALHPGYPAKICVRRGTYSERVVLEDRHDLVLEGCGVTTIVKTPDDNDTSDGLIALRGCTNITLRGFTVQASSQFGVAIAGPNCERIALEALDITTDRDPDVDIPVEMDLRIPLGPAPFPLNTIAAYETADLRILGCKLTMIGELSAAANVLVDHCTDVLVRGCKILTPGVEEDIPLAWGGVHVGGSCERVTLERNEIEGGLAYGVTLGTMTFAAPPISDYRVWFDPMGRLSLVDGSEHPGPSACLTAEALPPGGTESIALRPGDTRDVRIVGNKIRGTGNSAISVLGFQQIPVIAGADYTLIANDELLIKDNLIEANYLSPTDAAPLVGYENVAAYGGIILAEADDLRIRENVIRKNPPEPDENLPVCGIYVLKGRNITIDGNQIRDNGARVAGALVAGLRGGILLQLAGRRITLGPTIVDDTYVPAARVRGNVVHQPVGRALQIYGLGPMTIQGNNLVAREPGGDVGDQGHCVEIQNLGITIEALFAEAYPTGFTVLPGPLGYGPTSLDEGFLGGNILFTDNQVRYDSVLDGVVIRCANRIQSYGDVAVHANQFLTRLPATTTLTVDTKIDGWSTRISDNRWEDPILLPEPAVQPTAESANSDAFMSLAVLNQASACIHIDVSSPDTDHAVAINQTYLACE